MRLVVVFLLCNNLRAELFSRLFNIFSFYGSSNWALNNLNPKYDIHCNLDANKDLLVCGLKKVLNHLKIGERTKLSILCCSLDEAHGLKKTTKTELDGIKYLNIINKMFIKLGKQYSGLFRQFNFLISIIQLGEIINIININSSEKATTMSINEFIHEIDALAKKVIFNTSNNLSVIISNKDGGSSSNKIELCFLNNILIWFKNLLMMNENSDLYFESDIFNKIKMKIKLINKHYYSNMTYADMHVILRFQNGLNFVYSAMKLFCIAYLKTGNQGLEGLTTMDPNIIVEQMIANIMIYFGILPFSKKLYDCVVVDKNIDFWYENKMIGHICLSEFFNINKKNFDETFSIYYNCIIESLSSENIKSGQAISLAELLLSYISTYTVNINKSIDDILISKKRFVELQNAIITAKQKIVDVNDGHSDIPNIGISCQNVVNTPNGMQSNHVTPSSPETINKPKSGTDGTVFNIWKVAIGAIISLLLISAIYSLYKN